jgi:Hg(II)-responsive transcriptional regulator
MERLTIGVLARAAGVNVETIRYYERRGLLAKPSKPEEGYRKYPAEVIKRVRFIKRAQGLGFSLREIAEMLSMDSRAQLSCEEMLALARRKITEIDSKIKALQVMRTVMMDAAATCPGAGSLTLCPIWDRLENADEREEVRDMAKRKVEVFTAGCPVCTDLVDLVKATACPDCEVTVYNLNQGQGVDEAKRYGITAVPAVVVEGKLLDCCKRAHPTEHDLRAAGVGQPLR